MLVEESHLFLKLGRNDHSRQLNYTRLQVGIQVSKKKVGSITEMYNCLPKAFSYSMSQIFIISKHTFQLKNQKRWLTSKL